MRQLQEINEDIEMINNEMALLKDRKEELMKEKHERIFADFCEKYGVKRGDIVELIDRNHTRVKIAGASCRYSTWISCNKIKKNGDPYVYMTYLLPDNFAGCKIIKSKEG